MRSFSYKNLPSNLLQPDIINMVSEIHEFKGKQEIYIDAKPDLLSALRKVARIQSTDASNRIEGIFTTNKRLNELMLEKTEPRNRNEADIAGYRDVLSVIHEDYDHIDISPDVILQFHRDLFRYTGSSLGGSWKDADNVIAEYNADGIMNVRFKPLPAVAVPLAVTELCSSYKKAIEARVYDPLILACLFTFDFTCIHPFVDGNGRMSRLLTLLLLYQSGYMVGKYVSIEHEIEKTKQTYYEALHESSFGWSEGESSYVSFVRYLLGIILSAYRGFESRIGGLTDKSLSKALRVEKLFSKKIGKITKADILNELPDISQTTVERSLKELLDAKKIEKVGSGRATGYVRRER